MSKTKSETILALPYEPVAPLPPTDASYWVPCRQDLLTFRLGNRAYVEEISGQREVLRQRWRFRICVLGGDTAVYDRLERALRAAEFALGLREMPVRLPEVGQGKRKGGVQ